MFFVFGTTILVAVITFLASELLLPFVFGQTPSGKPQRHFYSLLLSVFSTVMTFTLTSIYETQRKIEGIEEIFSSVTESPAQEHFRNIFLNYHRHFKQPTYSAMLESWIHSSIETLSKQMSEGTVSLPSTEAKEHVRKVFDTAVDHIVMTHIGSISNFNESDKHWTIENDAMKRGIVIIRFYIFDGVEDEIADDNNVIKKIVVQKSDRKTLLQYSGDVKVLHERMGTLISIVISTDQLERHKRRELVIVDGMFAAESVAGVTQATGDRRMVEDARGFLYDLLTKTVHSMEHVHFLDENEVLDRFPRYRQIAGSETYAWEPSTSGDPLAKRLARHLLQATDSGS